MCDKFFASVDIPEDILFSDNGSLNIIHQVGKKVESNFVAHFMLTRFFRRYYSGEDNARALLLLNHHGKGHWISIGNKLGTNLIALQETGSLVIVDIMKTFFENLTNGGDSFQGDLLCLERLFNECKEKIEEFQRAGSRKILILVDNLTNYLRAESIDAFNLSEKNIVNFLHKLNALSAQEGSSSVTITAMVQSPEIPTDATLQSHFTKTISQTLPTVVFEVSPLKTGFSAQVTGFLKVTFNPRKNRKNQKGPFIKTYHFKLENNNAIVTPISHSFI